MLSPRLLVYPQRHQAPCMSAAPLDPGHNTCKLQTPCIQHAILCRTLDISEDFDRPCTAGAHTSPVTHRRSCRQVAQACHPLTLDDIAAVGTSRRRTSCAFL